MGDALVPEKPQSAEGAGRTEDANLGVRDGIYNQGDRPFRPWRELLKNTLGAGSLGNIPQEELSATLDWLQALEDGLASSPTPVDVSLLGSLARLNLAELRLARTMFKTGTVSRKGEIKASLVELRHVAALKASLLGRLRFRRDPRRVQRGDDPEPLTFVDHDKDAKP